MSNTTGIEWTDATWNPIRGCSRVSEGCRNCYAERVAYRFSGAGQPYEGLAQLVNGHAAWTGKVALVEKHLLDPLKWKTVAIHADRCGKTVLGAQASCTCPPRNGKLHASEHRPRRIFVNSMSDLFHPNVPDEWIDRIFAVMALCPQHTFQVLTKRPERMLEYLRMVGEEKDMQRWFNRALDMCPTKMGWADNFVWPLPNVQLGVSVEEQKTAAERIPLLLQTPAAVRFISAEPMLGAIDVEDYVGCSHHRNYEDIVCPACGFVNLHFGKLDWVICGGESGPGARPMHPDWARSLRDQCVAAGVPFFFKQWGEYLPSMQDGALIDGDQHLNCSEGPVRVGKKAAGALLDGREWKEFPR